MSRASSQLPLVGYSVANFGKNLVLSTADITFFYVLTDMLGLSAHAAGSLMLLALIGDLILEIGIAGLVARVRRFGIGYRMLIMIGAPPCGVAFALLYALPWLGERRLWVLAATLITFRATYGLIDIPHNALMTEVAPDSRARVRTAGYRLLFSSFASLIISTRFTKSVLAAAADNRPISLAWIGVVSGLALVVTLIVAAAAARPARGSAVDKMPAPSLALAWLPRFDRMFCAILAISFVTGFALPMFGRMMLYLANYVYGRPELASDVLTVMAVAQVPATLLWMVLGRRLEKTTLLISGYLTAAAGMGLFAACGAQPAMLLGCAALIGFGLSSAFMLPWALLADGVDFSEYRFGDRRETAMFAMVLVVIKSSAALSTGLAGWLLSMLGYSAGHEQASQVRAGIQALGIGLPLAGCLVASLVAARLPLTHRRHAAVVRQLAFRRGRPLPRMLARRPEFAVGADAPRCPIAVRLPEAGMGTRSRDACRTAEAVGRPCEANDCKSSAAVRCAGSQLACSGEVLYVFNATPIVSCADKVRSDNFKDSGIVLESFFELKTPAEATVFKYPLTAPVTDLRQRSWKSRERNDCR